MHKSITNLAVIMILLSTSACGGGDSALPQTQVISMFKFIGERKCEPGSGLSLAGIETQLADAGIPIYASTCGNSGIVSMPEEPCGTQDLFRIGIVDIAEANVPFAKNLGFATLSSQEGAIKTACQPPSTPVN
jgi:hypothetical protein